MSAPTLVEIELGDRVERGLRAENFGLQRQRVEGITKRRVYPASWEIEYGPDGMACRMLWCPPWRWPL